MHRLKISIDNRFIFETSLATNPETEEELAQILEEIAASLRSFDIPDPDLDA